MGLLFFLITVFLTIRVLKDTFKIGYYETKLENMDVDISIVKNMSLWEMFKLG